MKKTLITLLALSGIAMGGAEVEMPKAITLPEYSATDEAIKGYMDFNGEDAISAGTWKGTPQLVDGYANITTGKNGYELYMQGTGLTFAEGWTISFDVKDAGNGTLMSISSSGTNANWRYASLKNTDGTVALSFHGKAGDVVSTTISSTEWTTLTVVGVTNEDEDLMMALYKNGVYQGQTYCATAGNFIREGAANIQFGYYTNAANTANMSIDNVLLYNKAVPEPTTATLSLLALAGLAARRRRRK